MADNPSPFRIRRNYQCAAIVQPGEYKYPIPVWDGKLCYETNPTHLGTCELCRGMFCYQMHYHKHLDSHTQAEWNTWVAEHGR